MEPFSPQNGAGSEKRDFLEILLKPKRQLDFQGSDPPKIDPKSIPEAIRKQARKKDGQKVRVPPPKVDFWAPGSILEFIRGLPKSRFGPPRNCWVPKVFDPLGRDLFWPWGFGYICYEKGGFRVGGVANSSVSANLEFAMPQ